MACFHPIAAFRCASGDVVFSQLGRFDIVADISLPCGQCIGCRLDRARDWSIRCLHEAKCHEQNCFLTLTYAEEHVPAGGTLRYSDFQGFMKRLRRRVGIPGLRFFMCGEYGEETWRPHYHACIFGYDFSDKVFVARGSNGDALYSSAMLDSLWKFGIANIGAVTMQSAGYVARYCLKKVNGDAAESHYSFVDADGVITRRQPEFARMSLKPGIGARWFERFGDDCLPRDYVVHDGRKFPVPRYYDKLHERAKGGIDEVKLSRVEAARQHWENNTDARLAVREEVTLARTRAVRERS